MSGNLIQKARSGDRDAFEALVSPHRTELQVHCYRMLGSIQDAEDAVQETLLSAWLGIDGFEGRSGIRTWLYRIATNRCLNHLRAATRRSGGSLPSGVPAPSSLSELTWLQPFPDQLLEGLPDELPGPESRYEAREAITLAFITAMQRLQPRQRAVLILRDVLGYPARETAEILDASLDAVNNDVKRARAALRDHGVAEPGASGGTRTPAEDALAQRFVDAFVALDVDAMVGMMSDDVWLRMPPLPFEYHGRDAARQFFEVVMSGARSAPVVVPTSANNQHAWADYRSDPNTGLLHLTGIEVLTVGGGLVRELTRFEGVVAPWFGLPRTLTERPGGTP